ncbi:MAG: DUF6714 family protein [Verrucomicrobiota bacterium]
MLLTKESICEKIRRAFHGVRLGNGIGLSEADGIDEYADATTVKAYRERDEKDDWRRIPRERLRGEGLCFTDAEGMRFHLPAFMIAAVECGREFSPVFMLEKNSDLFVLFSPEQRDTVREFLVFAQDDSAHALDQSRIEKALSGPWK